MKILFINAILFTPDNNIIPQVKSIKDTMAYNFALGFLENDHDITLYAAKEYQPVEPETYAFNVIFDNTKFKSVFKPTVLPYLAGLKAFLKMNHSDFDLIVCSEVFSLASLTLALYVPASKIILWHELALHQKKFYEIPSRFWYNIIARLLMRKCLVIPRSKKAGTFISQYMPLVSNIPVEHGINVSNFVYKAEKKNQFIVVAQLTVRKNIGSIISKFDRFIKKYHLDYQLLIVGRGALQETLQIQIDSLRLNENVHLLGFKNHEELSSFFGDSRALLIDTKQDNNMVSIPESIACGTPVLTNLVPTNASWVQDNGVGLAKNWNEDDLYEMASNNFYIHKCATVRNELSNRFLADKMIKIWKEMEV